MKGNKIRLGTRGSKLALTQTNQVKEELLLANPGLEVEVIDVKTLGDLKQGTPLASKGDKKDWIYELELGILSGAYDLVVHSAKDIPSDIEAGTEILPILKRETPFDVFIGKLVNNQRIRFSEVEKGSKIGTASLRRKASLLKLRPDLEVVEHRGNITTRLEKLDSNPELSGIVLAAAGLNRLGLHNLYQDIFDVNELLPAVNQGILAVQFLSSRKEIKEIASSISNLDIQTIWRAERAVVDILKGDCKSCVGIFASILGAELELRAKVLLPDGSKCIEVKQKGLLGKPKELGEMVADELIERGALKILEASRGF